LEAENVDMAAIRQASWDIASKLGFAANDGLPLLDASTVTRSKDEIVNRVFGTLSLAASAYGLDRRKALAWLEREGSLEILTSTEREFLGGRQMNPTPFIEQIEGMWALCWSLKVVPDLDFAKPCSGDFVKMLPDLKKDEAGAAYRRNASLRDSEEVVAKCDVAYCLHWAVVHAGLTGKLKKAIKPYVIVERRRALEWLLSDETWDEAPLDT
jgi:hypothetical protein